VRLDTRVNLTMENVREQPATQVEGPRAVGRARRLLRWALVTLAVGASLATVAAVLSRWGWVFELTSHFRVQYACVLTVAGGLIWVTRGWQRAALPAVLAIFNLGVVTPDLLSRPPAVVATQATSRLVLCNVYKDNSTPQRVVEFVRASDADLVLLLETNDQWDEAVASLRADYPYYEHVPNSASWAVTFLSRYPIHDWQRHYWSGTRMPYVTGSVEIDGRSLAFVLAHPISPTNQDASNYRNAQLRELGKRSAAQAGPRMLVGDLNVSPWSPYFQDLLETSGLRDSRTGRGIQASWPAPLPGFRIPIDHCLVSSDISVHARRLGPRVGSDHLPVILDFSLTP